MNCGLPAIRRHSSCRGCSCFIKFRHQKPLSVASNPVLPFKGIHLSPLQADFESYACLLRECISLKSLSSGFLVHNCIVKAGLEKNAYLANLIMDVYGHFAVSLPTAYVLFKRMPHPDLFSWNFIIRAYQHSGLYMETLGLFQQMLGQGEMLPDQHICVSMLSVCGNVKSIDHGRQLHALVTGNGFETEIIVATSLINMYAKCGSMWDVLLIFDRMPSRDIFTWNTLITAYMQHGHCEVAIQLMKQLYEEGCLPSKEVLLVLIDVCRIIRAFTQAKHIHASIASNDSCLESTVQKYLSNMYMQCTCNSTGLFSESSIGEHDAIVVSTDQAKGKRTASNFNASSYQCLEKERGQSYESLQSTFTKYSQEGLISDALQILKQMNSKGIVLEKSSLMTLISACASQAAMVEGETVSALIAENDIEVDIHLGTALLVFYGKSGKLEVAIELFDRIPIHDVVSWTAMIDAHLENGRAKEALVLYKEMKLRGIQPNEVTYTSVLGACISVNSLTEGQQLHQEIIGCKADQNLFVGTALVNMYGCFGCLEDATIMFDKMPCRDVVAWNALLSAAIDHKTSIQLCKQIFEEGVLPNRSTIIAILNACAFYSCLSEGKQRHAQAVALDFELDLAVGTGLILLYGKCKCLTHARLIYDMILNKDSVFCTAMLASYAHHGMIEKAFTIFDEMLSSGIEPDSISCISILSACVSKTGLVDGRQMHMRSIFCGLDQDARVISGLISMYGKYNSTEDAIRTLQIASRKDKCMYVSALFVCANQPDLVEGRKIHMHIVENGLESETLVGNALISMYSKCGILEEARAVFQKLSQKDIVSWTVMITSHAQHGQGDYALRLFDLMQLKGVHPNKVTFTNILNAFTHAGMVDEGFECFTYAHQEHSSIQLLVEHYNVMVDLLGKAGRLSEAENLIKKMPFSATACTWTSMLDACRSQLDVEKGERAAEQVFQMRPNDRAPHIMMQNIYVSAGGLDA